MIPPCLKLSDIRHVSRVKWSNPGKGVAPSPTPWCSSYWKGSLLVTLDYDRQQLLVSYQSSLSHGRYLCGWQTHGSRCASMLYIVSLSVWFESDTDEVQHSLIQELMLYQFDLGYYAMEAAEYIHCMKGERAVDHCSVQETQWSGKVR